MAETVNILTACDSLNLEPKGTRKNFKKANCEFLHFWSNMKPSFKTVHMKRS